MYNQKQEQNNSGFLNKTWKVVSNIFWIKGDFFKVRLEVPHLIESKQQSLQLTLLSELTGFCEEVYKQQQKETNNFFQYFCVVYYIVFNFKSWAG